ncbi:MAG: restriction endonuclease subunit S [Thermodesulfobacteriota bacterium]|nr:restriction endonuclease subunit S [Thermodesulfobacteriota bacterium]
MSKDYLATNLGEYPVYSSQTANLGVFGRINTYAYDGEYVTWTTDGANAGSVFHRNGKFSVTNV